MVNPVAKIGTQKARYHRIRNGIIIFLFFTIGFATYALISNSNSTSMTTRQKILKAVYPVMMWFTKATGTNTTSLSNKVVAAVVPIYDIPAVGIDGKRINLNNFKGKKILLVNTASDCGYTGQYDGLEKLQQEHMANLVVLGFPANDFKEQEKGTNADIAAFCRINFGVSFPIMKKSKVTKGNGQNEIFQWLTQKNKNGWNDQAPTWNFCKYLVNEQGNLVRFFASSVEPMSTEVLDAIAE